MQEGWCKYEGLRADWFLDPEQVIRFGVRPNLIEVLTRVDGADFAVAYSHRVIGQIEGLTVNVISLPDLKINKQASGRNKDLADLDNLP
jgi:hypothetical protein